MIIVYGIAKSLAILTSERALLSMFIMVRNFLMRLLILVEIRDLVDTRASVEICTERWECV